MPFNTGQEQAQEPRQSPFAQRAQLTQQGATPQGKDPSAAAQPANSSSSSAADWASGTVALDWNQKILAATRTTELQSIISQLTAIRDRFSQSLGASGSQSRAQIEGRGKDNDEELEQNRGPLRSPQQGGDAV